MILATIGGACGLLYVVKTAKELGIPGILRSAKASAVGAVSEAREEIHKIKAEQASKTAANVQQTSAQAILALADTPEKQAALKTLLGP